MKKLITLGIILFILTSCGNQDKIVLTPDNNSEKICNIPFLLGNIDKTNIELKGIIINDDLKIISSSMGGVIKKLKCNAGEVVYPNTLIAQIQPDFNNSNTINLSIQKGSLINQKINLEGIKESTISSFNTQITNLKEQIFITKKNIELTKKSSGLSKDDLENQIKSLEDTLKSLNLNIDLIEKSKIDALDKININKSSLFVNIKSISNDNLLKIDEFFGFTDKNRSLNDKYESYISAKNTSMLSIIKKDFFKISIKLKNINNLSDKEISNLLIEIVELNENTKNAIKNSIVNVYFPQTQIDSFYTLFLNFGNNLSGIKSSWDSLENSKISTINTFESQIISLKNQIDTTKTNLDNLKINKIGSVNTGLDLQLSNLNSGLKTLESNLENLYSTKDTQILSLKNQIIQINQNIDSINTSLSVKNIYAGVNGTVKQKLVSVGNNVGINSALCNIIPKNNSTKIKIYSPIELNIGDVLLFIFNGKEYRTEIKNALIYKDNITQNYIYESDYLDDSFKDGEILKLKVLDNGISEKKHNIESENTNKIIQIPVGYIINKIDGNFVKVKSNSGILTVKVDLGDINGSLIEIKKGLKEINKICK